MNLSLRFIALIMIVLFVLSSALFYRLLNHYYEDEAFKRIEQAVGFDKALQSYINDVQKPSVYGLIQTGHLPKDFFDPTLLSSTFIANHVNDLFVSKSTAFVRLKFASDNPTNSRNRATSYEREILEKFRAKQFKSYRDKVVVDGKENLFYALPVAYNTNECLKCHGRPSDAPNQMRKMYGDNSGFGEKRDHLRAIVAIYTPIETDNDEMIFFFWSVESLMLFVFGLIYGLVYYYSHTISKKDELLARQSRFAAMGEMIGMIAHQWRQPLTGIGMTVNNMKLDIELSMVDEVKWTQQLEVIESQITYLSHTIDDFRNFFKPNKKLSEVNIKALIDDALRVIESSLKSHDITVTIVCDDIVVNSARNDLMQVLLNLIKNVQDAYMQTQIVPSPLDIEVVSNNSWLTLSIKDSAGGISPKIIHDIFNPYFSTKDEKNGTGLGLYMSKMIIEEHLGGKLDVVSDNGMTQFSIRLPISTAGQPDGNQCY